MRTLNSGNPPGIDGKPVQTAAEYSEQQKRLLFRNDTKSRLDGIVYLVDVECLTAARDAAILALEHIQMEMGRRETVRRQQLALDFGTPAIPSDFELSNLASA
jgi:hypothetical protein